MSNSTDNTIEDNLNLLSEIPSVPFLPIPRIKFLENYLKRRQISFKKSNYSLIVQIPGSPDAPKLIFMTHLDHPGTALKNCKEGIFLGSIGIDTQMRELKSLPFPIKIYDKTGNYVGKGKVLSVSRDARQEVQIETDLEVKPNFSTQWDLSLINDSNTDILHLYSADNDAATAAMMTILSDKSRIQDNYFNLYFVFNFFEEVNQVSSYYLAKNNILNLTETDIVINLECKEVFNTLHAVVSEEILGDKGLVLMIGENGCLYGYRFKSINLAEDLVKRVCIKNEIRLQTGVVNGSCDARPFSQFKLTPNICTVAIPNKYKHNIGDNGEITYEQVYKKDLNDLLKLLKNIIITSKNEFENSIDEENLSLKLKKEGDTVTDISLMKKKKILNERLLIAYTKWLQDKRVFPNKKIDYIWDLYYRFLSYLKYVYLSLKKYS